MGAVDTFRSKSSGIVARLLGDFPIHHDDAFAILGNLGHECDGFTKLQEIAPTVKGSRGGYGWPQWTGPRRRAYEAYCTRNKLDPAGDEANYRYLFLELKGSEARALPRTTAAPTLDDKVEAFEQGFLRAGVKHYPSRQQWARIAREEWERSGQEPAPLPVERKREILVDEAVATEKRASKDVAVAARNGGGGIVAGGTGGVVTAGAPPAAAGAGFPWAEVALFGLSAVLVGAALWMLWRARKGTLTSAALHFEASKLEGV